MVFIGIDGKIDCNLQGYVGTNYKVNKEIYICEEIIKSSNYENKNAHIVR